MTRHSVIAAIIAAATLTPTAHAGDYGRSVVQGFYAGMGTYAGTPFGPAGQVAGGAIGNSVGGYVYDAHESAYRDFRSAPRYQPVYPNAGYGYPNSTPQRLNRRY